MAERSTSEWDDINRHYFGEILAGQTVRNIGSRLVPEHIRFYSWDGIDVDAIVTAKETTASLGGKRLLSTTYHTLTISKPVEDVWLETVIRFDPYAEKILKVQRKVNDPEQRDTVPELIAYIFKALRLDHMGLTAPRPDDYDTLHLEMQRGAHFKLHGL